MLRSMRTRPLPVACVALLLAACGGGGGSDSGGGGGGGNANSTDPSVSIDSRTMSVNESAWDTGQQKTALLTAKNMPAGGAWISISSTSNGVANADFVGLSDTTANVIIMFRPGTQTAPGTYTDTVTVKV